jgi:hypothetical protein
VRRLILILALLACAHPAGAGEWFIEFVDETGWVGEETSIALDSADRPHISYYDHTDFDLEYAHLDGDEWVLETVDSAGSVGRFTSIELDSNDHPRISYYDGTDHDLKYAWWDGAQWNTETVDADGQVGRSTSLELDGDSYPHISYYDYTDGDLKYARWDGDEWRCEIVDSGGLVGWVTSLALDSGDNPHISYWDYSNWALKYVYWDGSGWVFYTVDPYDYICMYTAIALDSADQPHIAYYDDSEQDLKYAWYDADYGVDSAEVTAGPAADGILVAWTVEGDVPSGLWVLRSAGADELEPVSGTLPGAATRWLDRDAYDASDKGLKPLVYWLEVTEADGSVTRFGPTEAVTVPGSTGELSLSAYPNPVTSTVAIQYNLPEEGGVELAVYDLSGRRIVTLVDAEQTAGRHEVAWGCAGARSGVYVFRLTAGTVSATERLVIAR